MNTINYNNTDESVEALTLRIKQILERSVSSNENFADSESTLSSVGKLKHTDSFEPTPLSNTSINSSIPAAVPLNPVGLDENSSFVTTKPENIVSNQTEGTLEPKSATEKTRCPYCDKECDAANLRDHTDACESRQIECEACGEKVELDIFDFHLETCTASLYRQYNGDFMYAPGHMHQGQEENQQEENWQEEGEMGEIDGDAYDEDADEHDGPMSVSDLTYEQLIALDNTIVKKGLTDEELEKCPVEVHLKELDAPVNCTVCLSEAESGEFIRKLSCGHKFHRDCVDTWLKNNITCPSCKTYLR